MGRKNGGGGEPGGKPGGSVIGARRWAPPGLPAMAQQHLRNVLGLPGTCQRSVSPKCFIPRPRKDLFDTNGNHQQSQATKGSFFTELDGPLCVMGAQGWPHRTETVHACRSCGQRHSNRSQLEQTLGLGFIRAALVWIAPEARGRESNPLLKRRPPTTPTEFSPQTSAPHPSRGHERIRRVYTARSATGGDQRELRAGLLRSARAFDISICLAYAM